MKNRLFLTLLFLSLTLTIFSQPMTTLHFIGGYSLPLGDMKGKFGSTQATFTTNADSNTYFMQDGFSFGMGVKHSPFKNKGFKIIGAIIYNGFSQSTEYTDITDPVQIKLALRILSITAGVEYSRITKRSRFNPFIGAEFSANFFSGNYSERYNIGDDVDLSLKPTIRYGIQFGGGVDFVLGQRLGFLTGIKYSMANLIGKESTGDIAKEYSLNDKEGIVNNVKYYNRSINYLQIYGGITLYLGL